MKINAEELFYKKYNIEKIKPLYPAGSFIDTVINAKVFPPFYIQNIIKLEDIAMRKNYGCLQYVTFINGIGLSHKNISYNFNGKNRKEALLLHFVYFLYDTLSLDEKNEIKDMWRLK